MNLAAALAGHGYRTLLMNLDPQAQITACLHAGDGLTSPATIVVPMAGKGCLAEVIHL
jgi:cellulose biosynthesis protein BcsQ